MNLLRYRGKHHLYFPGQWALPQLNPLMSRSHNEATNKRTKTIWEPTWLFRLRNRFASAGPVMCGDMAARWLYGADGNRVCDCCGSIHPDDLLKIARKSLRDERYAITGTDKGYKFYVKQPGVRNAGEGAIKFYTMHMPKWRTKYEGELFREAVLIAHKRWQAAYAKRP